MSRELIVAPLRPVRAVLGRLLAAAVERYPALEPWFVRTGRWAARRSRFGGRLYWFSQEVLMKRLRRTGHKYRPVSIRDYVVDIDITDVSGRMSFFYSSPYRKQVVDAMMTALKPGDVFLDVGAHLGYFSMIAARVVGPSGRVVAFEPHERLQGELRTLVARNQVDRIVEIVPAAVVETEANVTLYTSEGSAANTTVEPDRSPVKNLKFRPATVVPAISLDEWLARRPALASRVRCIKIDVQGAESRVVAGMGRTLQPAGVTILCDTSIGSEADLTLERAGYRRHRIERGTASYGNFLYVRPGRGFN